GVYAYGSSNPFPNNTFNASNYWVDVVYQPTTISVIIASTAQEGQTLTANPSGAVTGYQWQSFIGSTWTNISGGTSSTYLVQEADEGNQLRVHVTSSGGSADSAATSAVIETSLIPTITPGIHTVNGNNGHVTFIVTFPEAVATVGTNDFTLFGRATGSSPPPTIASVSGSGASYTVTVNYAENRNAGLSLG